MTKSAPVEKRKVSIRRDLNDLVRDPDGKVSKTAVGLLAGQGIAVFMLLTRADAVIKSWEILTILLSVLVAPDTFKKALYVGASVMGKGKQQ